MSSQFHFSSNTLIELLEGQHFQSTWLKNSKGEVPNQSDSGLVANTIIGAGTEIAKFFQLLFLSGEYLNLLDHEEESYFDEIEKYLNEHGNSIEELEEGPEKYKIQEIFRGNIILPFTNLIRPLSTYLLRDVRSQLNLEYTTDIFRGERSWYDSTKVDDVLHHHFISFQIVIRIIRSEHFGYSLTNDLIRNLVIYYGESRAISIDTVLKEAISVKVDFLLKKLLYRAENDPQDSLEPRMIYSFDRQEDKTVDLESIVIHESLSEWERLIKVHYGLLKNFKSEQRKRRKVIEKKSKEDYVTLDFHGLIKIYKDDSKNFQLANELYQSFSARQSNGSTFNKYSNEVSGSYLFNNIVSLECEIGDFTVDKAKELFSKIKNKQNEDEIRNYFPWEKLATKLNDILSGLSRELVENDKLKSFNGFLDVFAATLKKLEEAYRWSQNKKLVPIQPNFAECQSPYIIKLDNYPDIKLFFFSSFMLPLDYKRVSSNITELEEKYKSFTSLKTVYSRLISVVSEMKDVTEKMRKQERRSIEILAIFSAVALFSVGSIQIFGVESIQGDPHVYYRFILAYGYSLALFVLLIWIITRENLRKVFWFHWTIVILVFLGTLIAVGYANGASIFKFIKDDILTLFNSSINHK
ncbi:MAG TPA: hypothetical protein H9825_09075 [Candidatus Sphingobacterium stercorigallinarum]|nr:hypothetical protein [Candidatus Sphingobacterium stercorigallinarum]